MNAKFPQHKPEDADLSNVKGYTGHPGKERVKADLGSQHKNSAHGQAAQNKEDQTRFHNKKNEVHEGQKKHKN